MFFISTLKRFFRLRLPEHFARIVVFACLIIGSVYMTGCTMVENLFDREESREEEGRFTVYYTNTDHSRLLESKYEPSEETFEGMLGELLDAIVHPPGDEWISVLPENVFINGYTIGVDNLILDFSGSYIGMTNVEEVLLRAGLVKTLIQLPGIYSVSLTVDGQPLTESASGMPVGPMRAETFVDTQDGSISSYQFVRLELYFPERNGSKLGAEEREAFYSSNPVLGRVITEQLIKGPENSALLPVADPSVQINSVKISDNICIIDVDETFNQTYNPQVSPQMCLDAFVNSICNACEVEGVSFRINGVGDISFRGEISLDQVFAADSSLIHENKEDE